MARLTWDVVREIRYRYAQGEAKASIANSLGVNRGTVFKIRQ